MAKKKVTDEELDEELEETEEEPKSTEKKIELDFTMDPVERLKIEISAADTSLGQPIGKYLMEVFSSDTALRNAYKTRKITLEGIVNYVNKCAKAHLHSKNGAIEDKIVFGWVLHYIQDEDVKVPDSDKVTVANHNVELTEKEKAELREKAKKRFEDEEYEKIKKAEARKAEREKKRLEELRKKEEEEKEEYGQISLFDFDD